MEYFDPKTIFTILHLFGVAIGAGGAYMSDVMYIRSVKDRVFSASEISFLKLGSLMVWGGLSLLIASGALLFSLNPEAYLQSTKFILKMIVVGVILVNGIVFHLIHLPIITKSVDVSISKSAVFMKGSRFIYFSGGISVVSWSCALVLGALRGIPVSIWGGLGIYGLLLLLAVIAAQVVRKKDTKPV